MPADAEENARLELESDIAGYTAAQALQLDKIPKSAWEEIVDNVNALSIKCIDMPILHQMTISKKRSSNALCSSTICSGAVLWARINWPNYTGVAWDAPNSCFGSSLGPMLFPADEDVEIEKIDETADKWLSSLFCDGFIRLFVLATKPTGEGGTSKPLVVAARTFLEQGQVDKVFGTYYQHINHTRFNK